MKLILATVLAAPFFLSISLLAEDGPFFSYKNKKYSIKDLDAATQSTLFEIEETKTKSYQAAFDEFLVNAYLKEKADKQKKTKEQVEDSYLHVDEVTDKQAYAWYQQNRQKIGTQAFDPIKPQIIHLLQNQQKQEKMAALLVVIKKEGTYEDLMKAPKSPLVKIAVDQYPSKNPKAKVQLVKFADYRCSHCKHAMESLEQIFTDKNLAPLVDLVYIDFPLQNGGISEVISQGAYCAKVQNKFWEYHNQAFNMQANLVEGSALEIAKNLNLNADQFSKCLKSDEAKNYVINSRKEGEKVGVKGTPVIFVRSKEKPDSYERIPGFDLVQLKEVIQKHL